jgi:ABC-2 type transport system permease protein
VKGYLVLDGKTVEGRSARYSGSNATAMTDMRQIERVVRQQVVAARLERLGVSPEVGRQIASAPLQLRTERLTATGRGGSAAVSVIFAVIVGMTLYFTIFIYGQMVLRGVMEEKQSRVAEVVLSSVRAETLMAGKVIGVCAVGLTQLVAWVLAAFLLYKARGPVLARFGVESPPIPLPHIGLDMALVLVLFFLFGYTFYAGLFAAIGSIVTTEQEAQQAQTPVILLLISSIMFVQNVLLRPDSPLAKTLSLLPFSAPIVMPLRMSVVPVPGDQIALSLLSVGLGAAIVTWIAARIYRTGLLMYGKRASLGEIARWVARA